MTSDPLFWHEKLDVYRLALAFVSRVEDMVPEDSAPLAARSHLDRAGESVLENIVSGNSSRSSDLKKYRFAIACGSALECAGCLDIFHRKGLLADAKLRADMLLAMRGYCGDDGAQRQQRGRENERENEREDDHENERANKEQHD